MHLHFICKNGILYVMEIYYCISANVTMQIHKIQYYNVIIFKGEIMAKKNKNNKSELKTVNVKFDVETKSRLETLAFIKRTTIQDLCADIICNELKKHDKIIAELESKRE